MYLYDTKMYQHGAHFLFKQYDVHLHGLDMRDTYTNSIIKEHLILYCVHTYS